MRDVAFWSETPQQGKSTVARFLQEKHGYERISFATPLKAMVDSLLESTGRSRREIEWFANEGKEIVIEGIGASYRHLARTLGTQWGRHQIHPNLWVNITESKIVKSDSRICVDDVRFENEIELLKRYGFLLVKIQRNVGRVDTHDSDTALRNFVGWHHVIENNGTLEELYSKVETVLRQ